MSVIALKWAYSQKISSPVEKGILAFLASHNFGGNESFFKIKTISDATAYQETAVREALKSLADQGYLKKEARYGDDGSQLSNKYVLNIPPEYVENFCKDYENDSNKSPTPPLAKRTPPLATCKAPPRHVMSYNNNINNNINKSSVTPFKAKEKPDYVPDWKKNEPRSNVKDFIRKPDDFVRANPEIAKAHIQAARKSLGRLAGANNEPRKAHCG